MKNYLRCGVAMSLAYLLTTFGQVQAGAQYDEFGTEGCCPAYVSLGCPSYTFDGQFTALYLQPMSSNLNYAAEAFPLPLPSPNWEIFDIKPDYHFGFDVGASVVCHERNSSVILNWEHFYSKDTASYVVATNDMVGPFFEIGPDAALYTETKGHATFHFDGVNLDYGVFVNFGECLKTNLYAGVNGVHIKQTMFSEYSNADKTVVRSIEVPSSFIGAGPQVGLDFAYLIMDDFTFTGATKASLLVGTQKNHTTYQALSPALSLLDITPPNTQHISVHKRTQLVPAFEGRLGLAYAYTFCNDFTVSLEAGYQAQVYFNALQSVDMGSEVNTPPVAPDTIGVFARTFHRTISNFALAGPYLALNVGF